MNKKDIKTYSSENIKFFLEGKGEKSFHANQIIEWLYSHEVDSFSKMTNLNKKTREILNNEFFINKLSIVKKEDSSDGSRKYLLQTNADKSYFEAVAIPSKNTLTVCVSTQIGCPMKCSFCATGKQKFLRNLSIGEIVDQVLTVNKDLEKRVTNVVVMGQGEPLLNYDNLIAALDILNNPKGIAIGARKITISTCGISNKIEKLAKISKQYRLAVSLHSADQNKRDLLMPGVKNYDLNMLKESLLKYQNITNRRITFEYLLLKDINDSVKDLDSLINYCASLNCHINLLNYNKTVDCDFSASDKQVFKNWMSSLKSNGIETTIRQSHGSDINGACGQLFHVKQTSL